MLRQEYVATYGCPVAFYSDRHRIFAKHDLMAPSGTGHFYPAQSPNQFYFALTVPPRGAGPCATAQRRRRRRLARERGRGVGTSPWGRGRARHPACSGHSAVGA